MYISNTVTQVIELLHRLCFCLHIRLHVPPAQPYHYHYLSNRTSLTSQNDRQGFISTVEPL